MSQVTFNIADYRPLFRVRTHETGPAVKARSGFVVLSSNSGLREYDPEWYDPRPAVVDIRSVREASQPAARHGNNILPFSNPAPHRVYMMPTRETRGYQDDDPGPLVA